MLSQHFSTNIFREKTLDSTFLRDVSSIFFNILHKNVEVNIFSKCYNIFQEKNQYFFSSSNFSPSSPTASSTFTSGPRPAARAWARYGRARRPPARRGPRADFFISPDGHLPN
jgi:hypothetical protein